MSSFFSNLLNESLVVQQPANGNWALAVQHRKFIQPTEAGSCRRALVPSLAMQVRRVLELSPSIRAAPLRPSLSSPWFQYADNVCLFDLFQSLI